MGKYTLAIKRSDFVDLIKTGQVFKQTTSMTDLLLRQKEIFNLKPVLFDRTEVTDDVLEIIPYVSLTTIGLDNNQHATYTYQRGTNVSETDIHGRWSIGLSTHVEYEPGTTLGLVRSFEESFLLATSLAIEKKLGVFFSCKKLGLGLRNLRIIHDKTNPANAKTLCVHYSVAIDAATVFKLQSGVIESGSWIKTEDLMNQAKSGRIDLEDWSRLALGL